MAIQKTDARAGRIRKTFGYLYTKGFQGLLAVSSTVEEVVVHAGHNALLVQDVRDTAIDGAKHGALHLPLLSYLVIALKNNGEEKKKARGCGENT